MRYTCALLFGSHAGKSIVNLFFYLIVYRYLSLIRGNGLFWDTVKHCKRREMDKYLSKRKPFEKQGVSIRAQPEKRSNSRRRQAEYFNCISSLTRVL